MSIFRRRPAEPSRSTFHVSVYEPKTVKAAEFHPSVRDVVMQLGGGWYCGTYGAMYRRQPAVRATVDFLARNVAQLNAKVFERVSDTDRLEVDDHPLASLLRNPNPVTTRYRHMYATVADLAIYDRAYWRKIRAGRSFAVARVSPARLQVETDQRTLQRTYRTSDGVEIPRSQLVIFNGYSPDTDDEGVSALETLRRTLLDEQAVQQYRENMWRNAALQSGWVERPLEAPEWSDTGRERFRADIEGTMGGLSNAGRIGVLEEGMTWNDSRFRLPDNEYVSARRLTYEEVAIVYGIDPSIIGMGNETKANAEQYHQQVYQDVLGPWLRMLQDELVLQLLPEFEPVPSPDTYVEFNIADKLKGSFEEQAKVITTSVGVPVVAPNEGRARLNLPRIDDDRFDLPVMPLNVMYGGQPAETIPTADPSTPVTAALGVGPRRKSAAPPAATRRRDNAAREHTDLFRKFFTRQEQAIVSAKAAKVDRDRWDRELTADLYLLATQTARQTGKLAARQLNGVYDEQQTFAYLATNARISAESINRHTFDDLEEADDARDVFEVAKGSRAEQLGLGRATTVINFARTEAGKQSQVADGRERTKTWVVTSSKSRHPEMSGETVAVSENFSNGLAWPGDGSGSVAEVAGCQCLLQMD